MQFGTLIFDSIPRTREGYNFLLQTFNRTSFNCNVLGMSKYKATVEMSKKLATLIHTVVNGPTEVRSLDGYRISTSGNTMSVVPEDPNMSGPEFVSNYFLKEVVSITTELISIFRSVFLKSVKFGMDLADFFFQRDYFNHHLAIALAGLDLETVYAIKDILYKFKTPVKMTPALAEALNFIDRKLIYGDPIMNDENHWTFQRRVHCFPSIDMVEAFESDNAVVQLDETDYSKWWDELIISTGITYEDLVKDRFKDYTLAQGLEVLEYGLTTGAILNKTSSAIQHFEYLADKLYSNPDGVEYIFQFCTGTDYVTHGKQFQMLDYAAVGQMVDNEGRGLLYHVLTRCPSKKLEHFLGRCIQIGFIDFNDGTYKNYKDLMFRNPLTKTMYKSFEKQQEKTAHFIKLFNPVPDHKLKFQNSYSPYKEYYGYSITQLFYDDIEVGSRYLPEVMKMSGMKTPLAQIVSNQCVPYILVRNTMLNECLPKEPKKPKKVKVVKVKEVKTEDLESVDIKALGGGGKSHKSKPVPVQEVYETKFTTIERDQVYMRIHLEHNVRVPKVRTYAEVTITKMTFQRFKETTMQVLGSEYSDDIAMCAYVTQHFDSKTATKAEKALRASLFAKEVVEVTAVAGNLVELKKVPNVVVMPVPPKYITVHISNLKHEYLFMRGLQSWKSELEKPEEVHEWIFEDSLRLGMVRFYNGLMLHQQDKGKALADDDHNANHLRNVMVHNFPTRQDLMADFETTICPLGERLMNDFQGIAVTKISKSNMFTIAVSDMSGSDARTMISKLLSRLRTYVKLLDSKQCLEKDSQILQAINTTWSNLNHEMRIWVHHARAIESCLLQIGQLSRSCGKFLSPSVNKYIELCREIRHIGYHWEFDPITTEFLADLIQGIPK